MTFTIALTGGIATGKSALAKCFEAIDVPVIDADDIAHRLTQAGEPALRDIVRNFGDTAIAADGRLDRKRMRQIVFNDPDARRRLEAILHPLIHEQIVERVRNCVTAYCLLAIPLFVEARDTYAWVDRVLVTDVPLAIQIWRLMQRPNIDARLASNILDAQASRAQRLAIADDVVDNTAPIERLRLVVYRLHDVYAQLATR